MIYALDVAGLVVALLTAVFLIYIMFKWPPGRDPRPMAPALALALAFFFLKLHPVMGWDEDYGRVREYAWRIWYIAVFVNSMLFAWLQGRRKNECGVGGACAVKRHDNDPE